jgi:hypothetical protein
MLYTTHTNSVALYGSEIWTLSQKDVNVTDSLEEKSSERYSGLLRQGTYRIRHKKKICELYNDVTLSTFSCV